MSLLSIAGAGSPKIQVRNLCHKFVVLWFYPSDDKGRIKVQERATPKRTKKQVVLEFLKERGRVGATGRELNAIYADYGSVIHNLRKDGNNIQTMALVGKGGASRFIFHTQV